MSQTNLLTGSQIGSFTPDSGDLLPAFGVSAGDRFEFHRYIQRITDSRGPRVVVHEFPNRDGALVETLGRKPHRSQFDLLFVGPQWRDLILALAKAIDASPGGLLVHPIYGQMRVVCHGFEQSVVEVAQFTDTITVPLVFTEDQQDKSINEQQGVAAKQQDVSSASTDFSMAAAVYADVATVQAVTALVLAASDFATAAATADTTNIPDPSLPSKLDAVGAALATVEGALAVDSLAVRSTAQTYDALASAEVLYAACIDLSDEVALETTGYFTYVVPGETSSGVLVQSRYGARALSVLDAVLQLNAGKFIDATAIPAGTELTLPL